MKTPSIPMSPSDLPQQRVVEVVDLPPCPNDIHVCLYTGHKCQMPQRSSRNVKHLCQVEWAWSPMNNRISSYYMHKGRAYWILWERHFDDNWDRWYFNLAASVPHKGCSEREAAIHLLRATWQWEHNDCNLDKCHWVNDNDLLSMADLAAVAREVWG